jgi:hypothetical protein
VLHCNIFPETVPAERSTSVGSVRSLSNFQIGGWGGCVWGQVLHCNIFPETVPAERSTSVGSVRSLSHFQIGGWGGWRLGKCERGDLGVIFSGLGMACGANCGCLLLP